MPDPTWEKSIQKLEWRVADLADTIATREQHAAKYVAATEGMKRDLAEVRAQLEAKKEEGPEL